MLFLFLRRFSFEDGIGTVNSKKKTKKKKTKKKQNLLRSEQTLSCRSGPFRSVLSHHGEAHRDSQMLPHLHKWQKNVIMFVFYIREVIPIGQ